MKTKSSSKIYMISLSAVFAALQTVFVYFFHIPNAIGGYIHFGDLFVLLAASLLPLPYAATASAIGFALADLISGYAYYMIPSAIIRVLIVLCFTAKKEICGCKRNYMALPISVLITTGGYFVFKYILYYFVRSEPQAALTSAIASIPGNLIQSTVSCVLFVIVAVTLDKMKFKQKIGLSEVRNNV